MAARAPVLDLAADRARALALTPVSRETQGRLERFVDLLLSWQRTANLIAPSTLPQVWTRHIADSLQLIDHAAQGRVWVDLGTGAGFPGLVIACALADRSHAVVHLVESNLRKIAFLREAVRVTGAPAVVHGIRIEQFTETFRGPPDVVTARALAPLNQLLTQSVSLLKTGTMGLFPKGRDVAGELTEASKCWNMQVNLAPSRTSPDGRIVIIRALERRATDLPLRQ
jgi:16S rRNA (guanine527-N7)-methyltransferase